MKDADALDLSMSNFSRRRSDRAFIDVFQNTHPKRADTLSVSDADSRVFDLAHPLADVKVEVARLQPGNHLVFHTDPRGVAADRFRYLRMRLRQMAELGKLRTLLITSAVPKDGKSTTALNLATALAEEGKRSVLLIEADLYQPTLRKQLGLSRAPGLAECMEDRLDPFSLIRRIEPLGWYLLSAGQPRGNPTELFQSDAFPSLMPKIVSRFDWVLFDSPPLTPLIDTLSLARQADASLLVVRAGQSPKALVEKAFELLGRKHVVGVVLNGVPGIDRSYSKYYGYYGKKVAPDSASAEISEPLTIPE